MITILHALYQPCTAYRVLPAEFSGEYRSSVTETTTKIGSDVQTQLAVQPPVDDVPRREIKVRTPCMCTGSNETLAGIIITACHL